MSKTPPTFLTLRALHLEVAHSAVIATALRYRAEVYRAIKQTADADALDRAADVLDRRTDDMRAALSDRGDTGIRVNTVAVGSRCGRPPGRGARRPLPVSDIAHSAPQ